MGRINHQVGERLFPISISFLIIFALLVSPVSSLEDVIDDDCNINQDVFDRDWKKYSNIDEQIPLDERKWPAKQYGVTESKIVDAKLQIFFLKRDAEVDRLMRVELREYKQALVKEHRNNLLKSFGRLSFLTGHTLCEAYYVGKSVGKSYVILFTTTSPVAATGSVLKIASTYSSMVPPEESALDSNTQGTTKAIKAIGREALESLGNPTKIGVEVFKQTIKSIPAHSAKDWKLTDDDFEILRTHHLKNKGIDKTLKDSYAVNLNRTDKVRELEAQIKGLEKELAEWEAEEKSRVMDSLVDSCKKEKKCDSEHLYLCVNEKDCKTADGYWYNNNCNDEPEEEDTSDGEFYCLTPSPNEASHTVEDYSEYWSTPSGFGGTRYVGPRYLWYDREKTKKDRFWCYNIDGELHGVTKMWYEDGTPKYECNYKDGKRQGVCKWWYDDGTPKRENNYKDGKEHGVCKMWRKDGTPMEEYNYKDGKEHGVSKSWYDDGTPHYERNYKDGKEHGVCKMWTVYGELIYECNYKDGKEHGVCKEWSVNGKLIYECNYEEGKCVSCVHGHC